MSHKEDGVEQETCAELLRKLSDITCSEVDVHYRGGSDPMFWVDWRGGGMGGKDLDVVLLQAVELVERQA